MNASKFLMYKSTIARNFLYRFSYMNYHSAYTIALNQISDNPNARKLKVRKGRGLGSSKGKQAGRGHKGKQRGYKPPIFLQGGQTNLAKRLPKFGRNNTWRQIYNEINIEKLYYLIQKNRLDPNEPITIERLFLAGGISKLRDGVKLLGRGLSLLKELPPLRLEVTSASREVIQAVKENNGEIVCEQRKLRKPYSYNKRYRDPIVTYSKVKKLLKMEENGATIRFNRPNYMVSDYQRLKAKYTKIIDEINKVKNRERDEGNLERVKFFARKYSYDFKKM